MEKVQQVKNDGLMAIEKCENLEQLNQVRIDYLSKKGHVQGLMALMKDLSKEEKPAFGQEVNDCKQALTKALDAKMEVLQKDALKAKLEKEKIDITVAGYKPNIGTVHPLMMIQQELEDLLMKQNLDFRSGRQGLRQHHEGLRSGGEGHVGCPFRRRVKLLNESRGVVHRRPPCRAEVIDAGRTDLLQGDAPDGARTHVVATDEAHGGQGMAERQRDCLVVVTRQAVGRGDQQVLLLADFGRDDTAQGRRSRRVRPGEGVGSVSTGRIGEEAQATGAAGPVVGVG